MTVAGGNPINGSYSTATVGKDTLGNKVAGVKADIVAPARIGFGFYTYSNSIVNAIGGTICGGLSGQELFSYDTSTINFSGAKVNDNGGFNDITLSVIAYNSSTINISGGSFNFLTGFGAADTSTVNVTGGAVNSIGASGNGTVNVTGGTVNSIGANGNGIVNLYGTGLALTNPVNQGSYTQYTLTGTLRNGQRLNAFFTNYEDASHPVNPNGGVNSPIRFNPDITAAPEPGSVALFTLGLLSVGGLITRRR